MWVSPFDFIPSSLSIAFLSYFTELHLTFSVPPSFLLPRTLLSFPRCSPPSYLLGAGQMELNAGRLDGLGAFDPETDVPLLLGGVVVRRVTHPEVHQRDLIAVPGRQRDRIHFIPAYPLGSLSVL